MLRKLNYNFQENLSRPGTEPRPGGWETLVYTLYFVAKWIRMKKELLLETLQTQENLETAKI
jgi:hypothetical protein